MYLEDVFEYSTFDFVSFGRHYASSLDGSQYLGKPENPVTLLQRDLKSGKIKKYVPIYAYVHSGVDLNLGSMKPTWPDQEWDCVLFGYLYMTAKNYKETFGRKRLLTVSTKLYGYMENFVKSFNAYINGDVYSVRLTVTHNEEIIYDEHYHDVYNIDDTERDMLIDAISSNQQIMAGWEDVPDKLFYRHL